MRTTVIGLVGGPGIGKSTIATGLFSELKQRKISCELVTEFAKECTWEGSQKLLENQIYIFSEQFRRQFRLLNKVRYIITDSPLILNSIYFDYYLSKSSEPVFSEEYNNKIRDFFDDTFDQFENRIYFIARRKDYDQAGRNETYEQAVGIDQSIIDKLIIRKIPYSTLYGTEGQNIESILYDNEV